MNQIWSITLKELKCYFASPIAYIITSFFLLGAGYFFTLILSLTKDAGMMTYLFGNMTVMLLFMCPLISMRLFAEEERNHTLELLMTSPISEASIVLGKFLASALLLALMLVLTIHFPILLLILGKPDIWPMVSGYLGVFLMGCGFLAIGMLTSTWTQNQIVAGAVSLILSLLLWFLSASSSIVSSGLGQVLSFLALNTHYESFAKGLLSLSDGLYFASLIGILLFVTTRSIETRRWR